MAVATEVNGKYYQAIQSRHPKYKDVCQNLTLHQMCYEGGQAYINERLDRFYAEDDLEREYRLKSATNENVFGRICDTFPRYVFASKDDWKIVFPPG